MNLTIRMMKARVDYNQYVTRANNTPQIIKYILSK